MASESDMVALVRVKVLPVQPKWGFAKVQLLGQEGRTRGHSPTGSLWDLIGEAQVFPEVS